MRYRRERRGVSSIVGSIFFVLIMIVAIASLVTMFNSFNSYNQQVNKASNSNLQAQETGLTITNGQFGAFPPSTTSNFNVATGCLATATAYTNKERVFYVSSMWWLFYTCNGAFQYSTSYTGLVWEASTSIPSVVTTGYTVGPYFDVEVAGSSIYLAIAEKGADFFQLGIGTLTAGGTNAAPAGTITWTDPPASVATTAATLGPINMAVDGAGNQWVSVVQGTCTTDANCGLGEYEHEACATASTTGWENAVSATCSNTNAPGNYAPTALGTLSEDVETIIFPAISSYSSTGVILVYESNAASATSLFGTLNVLEQTALASTTWTTVTITFANLYSLTSSSAVIVGTSLYFAGWAGASGATTGTVYLWTLPFTSMTMTAATVTETQKESTASTWMAALTYSGTTLVLFDNPPAGTDSCPAGDNCIQYYTSSTLGAVWSSAILLDSSEATAVTYLNPANTGFALMWTSTTSDNVRFAALSTVTATNNSPFAVHLVDLYVYNSGTNTLVAHYYYNSTEDFDYWVEQGSSMVLPIRFLWAATTGYLVTVGTDSGVTAQLTETSPPATTVTCPAGYFPAYQIGPTQTCSSVAAPAAPVVAQSSSADTCTDATATTTEMMDLGVSYTTSASSTGTIYATLTFNVATPATAAGLTSKWTVAYGTGTAPACNNGAAVGTTVGQAYTIENEVAAAGGMAQSETISLSGLSPSTAYWFDVQVSDSSAAGWVYSNAGLSVLATLSSGLEVPNIAALSTPTASCPDVTATTTLMMGFGATYTTGASGYFSGNVQVGLTFNALSPATATGVTSKWQIAYGTGTPPACNGASSGTTLGNQYTLETVSATVPLSTAQSETVSITGLSASTTYWFDVQVSDSTAGSWTYSNPTMAVVQEPTESNLPENTNFSPNAATCTISSATLSMAGLTYYTTPSSGSGSVFVSYAANVVSPATAALTSKWQIAYGQVTTAAAAPACAATAGTGTAVGDQYTLETTAALAMSIEQSGGVVINGLSHGTEYWFAVQVTDSSAGSWVYSNPEVQVVEVMPAVIPHSNVVGVENPNTCSDTTATTALMAGFATVYSTTSYGTGSVAVTLNWKITMPATASVTTTYVLAYGTGAPPACNAAAAGTTVGQTYEVYNPAGVATVFSPSMSITITGLTPGTTYWFDLRVSDSVATSTTNNIPTLTVVETI